MYEINNIYNKRKNEISQYIDFLDIILNPEMKILVKDNLIRINGYQTSTAKASLFLMIYNMVEAVVGKCIEKIHDTISNEDGLNYSRLNFQIKNLWLDYYISKNMDKKISKVALKFIDGSFANARVNMDFSEYIKSNKIFSGNIDAQKLREISSNYGISIKKTKKGEKLVVVKNLRNRLAHGEVSFSEGGRDFLLRDLREIFKDVVLFIEYFLQQTDRFILERKYAISE